MALRKQAFSVDLLGLDQKAPRTVNIPGTVDVLENAYALKVAQKGGGEILELRKRNGSSQLSTLLDGFPSGMAGGGVSEVLNVDGRLCARIPTGLLALYSQAEERWFGGVGRTGLIADAVVTSHMVRADSNRWAQCAAAVGDVVAVVSAGASLGTRVDFFDRASGTIVKEQSSSFDSLSYYQQIVSLGGKFFAFGHVVGVLKYTVFDRSGATLVGLTTVSGALPTTASFDVTVDGSTIVVAAVDASGTLTFFRYDADMVLVSSGTCAAIANVITVAFMEDNSGDGLLHLLVQSTTAGVNLLTVSAGYAAIRTQAIDASLTTAGSLMQFTGLYDGSTWTVLYGVAGGAGLGPNIKRWNYTGTGSPTPTVAIRDASLASRPWYTGYTLYVAVESRGTWFAMNLGAYGGPAAKALTDVTTTAIQLKTSPGLPRVLPFSYNKPRGQTVGGAEGGYDWGRTFAIPALRYTRVDTTAVALVEVAFGASPGQGCQLGSDGYFCGGLLYQFDGSHLVEHGFLTPPRGASGAQNGTGINLDPGTYQCAAVYEWTDASGDIHRSEPAFYSVALDAAHHGITHSIPALHMTVKQAVYCIVYRTKSVSTGGTVTYFRASVVAAPSTQINDTTVDFITFDDDLDDTTLGAQPVLYTAGDVPSHSTPPTARLCRAHKNRLVVVDEEDRVWISNELVPGEGLSFADYSLEVPTLGGSIVDTASVDQTLLVMKTSAFYQATGDYPNAAGQGSFPPVVNVGTNLGLSGPGAHVVTEQGLMFQSRAGTIWLAQRGSWTMSYAGAPVEDERAQVTSALVVPDPLQARFYTADRCLVYDLVTAQWSVFTPWGASGACLWNGAATWGAPSGIVSYEVPGQWHDAGEPIVTKIGISGIGLAGAGGLQRVWKVNLKGERRGPHSVHLSTFLNGEDCEAERFDAAWDALTGATTFGADSPFGAGSPFGGSSYCTWSPEFKLGKSRASLLRLLIWDSFPDGVPSEGFRLQHVGLIGATKPGQGLDGARVSPT